MIKLASRRSPQHPMRAPQFAGDEVVAADDTLEQVGPPAPTGSGVRADSLAIRLEQPEASHREELASPRTARHRRWRLIAIGAAGTIMIFAGGGCAGVSSSSPATAYWLVRVSDGYGNIYGYGAGERAPQNAHAAYLGPTTADAKRNAPAAAKRLGIAHIDPGIE
jgi:hypothetical protein